MYIFFAGIADPSKKYALLPRIYTTLYAKILPFPVEACLDIGTHRLYFHKETVPPAKAHHDVAYF